MDDAELEAQQSHDDAMAVKRQQAALVEAAEAVLSEYGIQVSDVLSEVPEDPSVRKLVSSDAMTRLGRCVLDLRNRAIPTSSPARPPPVDVRGALARCRRAREHLSLDGYLFEPWTDLLEAMAEQMAGKPLCSLCAADVPHSDSVCVERRERRLRTALRDVLEAVDRRAKGRDGDSVGWFQDQDEEHLVAAVSRARQVLGEV